MKLLVKFYFFYLISVASRSDVEDIEYYTKLIAQETSRAFSYKLPKDASTFATVSDSYSEYDTFDYIIVGAGSAGAIIATRLSEIKENKILLLEAGGHETDFSDIPTMLPYLQGLEFNWNYNTTSQSHACLGMINKECAYPRGRGLGGTSIINALMYVRGNKRDYNNWEKQGNPGWSYEDVLPYFKKSEDSHIDGDLGHHAKGGYLNVEYHKPDSPQLTAFIKANLELGRKVVDYNGKEQLGVARTQINTIKGRRDSTGKAFLSRAIDRPNLKVSTHSLATKVLIAPSTKKAYGMLFSQGGKLWKAEARKEIIISAGTVGSPQLLMLSGIGPMLHLLCHNIPVVQPLSVGNNLQDHAAYLSLYFTTNYTEPAKDIKEHVKEYLKDFGSFTIGGNAQGLGFFQTKLSKIPGYPDIEMILICSDNSGLPPINAFHYTQETANAVFGNVDLARAFGINILVLHPKSRGTIRLKSRSPYDYPLINPGFLSDSQGEDIETMYQGIQLALELVNTKAFKKLNATLVHSPVPACKHLVFPSKEFWYCQIRQLGSHMFHPTGTCKMGSNPFRGAVVNHELKVHEIKNLRVADASIIPDATSGHVNAASIMIGEKVSDMIKNEKY